jgi:hypothetical protein
MRYNIVLPSGSSSVVERDLAKVDVAGSTPVSRSRFCSYPRFRANRSPMRSCRCGPTCGGELAGQLLFVARFNLEARVPDDADE